MEVEEDGEGSGAESTGRCFIRRIITWLRVCELSMSINNFLFFKEFVSCVKNLVHIIC